LKRGWTRFWVSASLAALGFAGITSGPPSLRADQNTLKRNELRLASLRPGRDSVARARSLYGKPKSGAKGDTTFFWTTDLRSERLTVTTDSQGVIQEIRAERRDNVVIMDGEPQGSPWRTGKNLAIGDLAARVEKLYGKPDSRSPSTKGGQRLELLYYAFDWAGPDVPQVMEVVCTVGKDGQPGRVVEITLAASSL
jgi:hypothetical protein